MIESAILLFLVVDPFGNLPFVLAVTGDIPVARYRRIILRETVLAFFLLAAFAVAGEQALGYLSIERPSLSVAGGVILFLISLKMIFQSAADIFVGEYRQDPLLVPIATPSLAGPSAITTVMILAGQPYAALDALLLALMVVFLITAVIFLSGPFLSDALGRRGIRALEKLMGLLLNLVAVNMVLVGVREFLLINP